MNLEVTIYTTVTILQYAHHLRFKQALPKMCHSTKVEDGVEILFFPSLTYIFGQFFLKNFKLTYNLNSEL